MSKLTDSNPHISLMSHLIALGLIKKLSGDHQLEVAQIINTMKLEQLSGIDALSQEENTPEVSSANNCFDFTLTKCPVTYPFMV
jgi:U3 small nucleolar RNA-associated protein 10